MPNCIKNPEQECLGLAQSAILEHKIDELIRRQKEDREDNKKDHKEFFTRLEAGETGQALTQNQLAEILSDTAEIKSDIKESQKAIEAIHLKPGKNWEKRVEQIVGLVIAAVVALVLAKIGLTS